MATTFHALMLRSEKNNVEKNALGFTKKKLQPKCIVKSIDFINKTKSLTADFEMQTNVLCLRLESFAVQLTGVTDIFLGITGAIFYLVMNIPYTCRC